MRERDSRLDLLEPLIGTWETQITMLGPDGIKGDKYHAVDRYEWMGGEHFMLHHVDAMMPGGELKALEVLGVADSGSGFFIRSYDSEGGSLEFEASLDGRKWSAVSATLRFAGEFDGAGRTVAGRWHRREGEQWLPAMDVVLTKRLIKLGRTRPGPLPGNQRPGSPSRLEEKPLEDQCRI